ncbi:hypothetical protein N9L68_04135 [bacterium]|nr:hypothetical protein [bacterium]
MDEDGVREPQPKRQRLAPPQDVTEPETVAEIVSTPDDEDDNLMMADLVSTPDRAAVDMFPVEELVGSFDTIKTVSAAASLKCEHKYLASLRDTIANVTTDAVLTITTIEAWVRNSCIDDDDQQASPRDFMLRMLTKYQRIARGWMEAQAQFEKLVKPYDDAQPPVEAIDDADDDTTKAAGVPESADVPESAEARISANRGER